MTKERFDEIISELEKLPNDEKCNFLLSVIEETDHDNNGWNDELRELYNTYNLR